jgi:hypothetical protein
MRKPDRSPSVRHCLTVCLFWSLVAAGALAQEVRWTPELRRALDQITPASLQGHVSFLASDLLEGRGTPSRGLDVAAEYIAAQYRRAGIGPGPQGYFQVAPRALLERDGDAAKGRPGELRNVVGVLPGADPALRDTWVILSAHYDHLGIRGEGEGDHIYNGANDDASGTAALMAVAEALAASPQRPRRSLAFLAWFGEERGLVGSRFYGQHPLFPVEKTVANLNLEQVGRTDDSDGPRVGAANLTGFDYSTLTDFVKAAAAATGVRLEKHPRNSDRYFGASDNRALAALGIPAHTLSVAYDFPDYHAPGDHWDKLDYDNMAKITRMVALAAFLLADDPKEPRWNATEPKAAPYLKAWKERHGG